MYSDGLGSFVWMLFALNLIWLGLLTFFVRQEREFLKRLFPESLIGKRDFRGKLEEVLQDFEELVEFKKDNLKNVQKIALKRYNPYHDTGGDQSFSVVLLDGQGDGVVLTSLHSRSGTRVFAKPIKEGKEDSFELSEEESTVVKKALAGEINE